MIRKIDPADWKDAATVQIESDASENIVALREIEQWASEHGFARTTEYWLRQAITADNVRVFRGICYRITPDERRAAEQVDRRVEERASRMPVESIDV